MTQSAGVAAPSQQDDDDSGTLAALHDAEVRGLKIALMGRTAVLVPIVLIIAIVGRPPASTIWAFITLFFVVEGLFYFYSIGKPWERRWHKYAFFTLDCIAVMVALYFSQSIQSYSPPKIMVFRAYGPEIYYMLVGTAALALSPRLVLATGLAGALSWLGLFLIISSEMEQTLTWGDLPLDATTADYMALILNPDFVATGNRWVEASGIMLSALLLSFAVSRARRIVLDRARVERAKNRIEGIFGQYVPAEIVSGMLDGDGAVRPVRREATLLYLDVEQFTSLTERRTPEDVVDILSGFFDLVSRIFSSHGGTVINLNGDAVVAAFNLPVDRPDHADAALTAARELVQALRTETFEGEHLEIRVGISTGEVAAGTVGGTGRQTYTVHGDPINLASRLEAMNKDHDTRILFSGSTADQLKATWSLNEIGELTVRGKKQAVKVYTLKDL